MNRVHNINDLFLGLIELLELLLECLFIDGLDVELFEEAEAIGELGFETVLELALVGGDDFALCVLFGLYEYLLYLPILCLLNYEVVVDLLVQVVDKVQSVRQPSPLLLLLTLLHMTHVVDVYDSGLEGVADLR